MNGGAPSNSPRFGMGGYAEILRREQKKREMLQQAQDAGIPYSPEYIAEMKGRANIPEPPSVADSLRAQQNAAYPVQPPTVPPPVQAAPETTPPDPGSAVSNPPPLQQPPASPEPPPDPSIFDNPQAVEAVLGMGANNRAIEQAMKLRNTPGAEGRYTGGGRLYTASSPLEHLSVGLLRLKGKKDLTKAEEKQLEAKKSIIDALRTKPRPIASSTETDFYDGMLA